MGSAFLSPPAKRLYTATGMPDPVPYPYPNPHAASNGSSKRSKPPPAPLIVPPGHAAFRLLCHASRIGGVIGKSGHVIKALQQATGAKIRVEDSPIESPDRVVTVVATSALNTRMKLALYSNSGGDGVNGEILGDEEEGGDTELVSKAQEALVKVFERILEVAAETDGVGAGVGVVSCRLLAETSQIGSVIGKGGKVVEKIRKESGSKIRVLSDKLPACAGPSDEMVEIEGGVLAVKKALVAVSRRLQDFPPADKTRMIGSRPLEAFAHETLPDFRVDLLSQRNTVLPTMPSSSINYASGVHPLSIEADRAPTLNAKMLQQEVSFRILCSNAKVGGVIGKGGTIVKALQNESGASISVGAPVAECDERVITITASENPESRYSPAQKAAVLVFSRSVEAGFEKGLDSGLSKGSSVAARLIVRSNQVGCLLGKGGSIVSEIRKATGAVIRILGGDQVPKCATENDQVVQISGEFSNVQDALYNATGRLRDHLFSSSLNDDVTRTSSSALTEFSSYGRSRDPAPLGLHPGVSHGPSRHTTLTQSLDHLGLSHSLERPPSPRLWASETAAGVNPRSILDVGRGLTSVKGGLELGSGNKSAIVTNTTVEIVVPENVIGSVYGENGSNLTRLRQISGAKVVVHEPRPGTTERIIVISGTPDETQAAQSLLHAFILTGPS